ncbi:hypothetical protein EMCG_02618 [[Emmonsia] crescens]|uniref:Uncharacterized protein n=1 Tax=[Emmonsia] crescens TaxID=73230 RepID=A0A0G2HY43_9EURO|nr:hypothetical protein EMCG_02618 [Emmonsia crescens UAMH 3008]
MISNFSARPPPASAHAKGKVLTHRIKTLSLSLTSVTPPPGAALFSDNKCTGNNYSCDDTHDDDNNDNNNNNKDDNNNNNDNENENESKSHQNEIPPASIDFLSEKLPCLFSCHVHLSCYPEHCSTPPVLTLKTPLHTFILYDMTQFMSHPAAALVFLGAGVHKIILSDDSHQPFIIMHFVVDTLGSRAKVVAVISTLHPLL